MKVTWQRFYLFDILEQNEIDYDQILLVDADTIVHPDCPNFFELTNHEYSAVVNNGSFEWVKRSVEARIRNLCLIMKYHLIYGTISIVGFK